jgi:hypothetical protein
MGTDHVTKPVQNRTNFGQTSMQSGHGNYIAIAMHTPVNKLHIHV